ncbi:MAG: TonB-dependent receptor, partial [Steroidobacteraceae bacterium]
RTVAVASACLLPLICAAAQETLELEEVVVTATRRAQPLRDVPISITAVDPEKFAAGGLTTLEDVVNYTPGVNFQEGGSPGRQTISMRGVSQELGTPVVGMYLDDIPLGSGTQWGQASLQMPDLVKINLERIELIKGPQGTLYGASSMGGVVRYITKDPAVGDFNANVSLDLSSTQQGGFNTMASAAINIPLVDDRIGISLSGFDERNDGFIDRSALSVDGPREDTDAADSFGGIAKLVAHFSDAFTGTLTYAHHETQYEGINSVNLGPAPQLQPRAGRYGSLQGAQDSSTALQVLGATLSYDFNWATLLSSSSYQEVEFDTRSEQFLNFGPVFEFVLGFPPGAVTSVPDIQTVNAHR